MPQMAPMWWSFMYLILLMSIIMMMVMVFFTKSQKMGIKKSKINIKEMNWKW
nr:ATP synthase F0 subunit 8 [Plerochila australis]